MSVCVYVITCVCVYSDFAQNFKFLLIYTLGAGDGSSTWVPLADLEGLLVLAWLNPICCSHYRSEQVDGKFLSFKT